jgi:PAS domain S-box-containing protein
VSQLRPLFLAAVTFVVVLAAGGAFITLAERRYADEHRHLAREMGAARAHLLERQFDRSLASTFALASILRQSGEIDNFDTLAADIIESHGGISSLQLAPNGVVTQIYPLEGNEAAIGHDLLNDPERRTEALKAIESGRLTLAGPFDLIQGGSAVIGRLPVFVPGKAGGERFWGFAIALIRLPTLLEIIDLDRLVERGYDYELWRIDPDSHAPIVFTRSAGTDLKDAIPFEIDVPNGKWTLAIAPRGGWPFSSALPLEIVFVVLAGTAVAFLTYNLVRQPVILRREIALRTRDLGDTNRNLEAEIAERKRAEQLLEKQRAFLRQVIDIDPNFIFAKDREGRFTLVNQAVADAYGTTVEGLIGKTDADFNPNMEEVEFFRHMDLEVMDTLQERFIAEEVITDAQGKRRWLQTVKRPIIGEDGAADQVLGSATDITERKESEEALREREAALQRNQKDLQDLTGKLLTAQEAERRRLAREMHDDLTQRLAVLAIEAGKLEKQLESSGGDMAEKLCHMKEQMMKLAADVHGISRQLHPSILDDLGLVDAMEAECTNFSQREGIVVTYESKNVPERLSRDVGLCLYRITQEALRNIAKHSQAQDAHVSLVGKDGVIILMIADPGVGFDQTNAQRKRGLGLASMEERARLIQAEFSVISEPGDGTVIAIRAPLRGSQE